MLLSTLKNNFIFAFKFALLLFVILSSVVLFQLIIAFFVLN